MKIKFFFLLLSCLPLASLADLSPVKTNDSKKIESKMSKIPVEAIFKFYATEYSPKVPDGSYAMTGSFDPATRALTLKGVSWIKRPQHYEMVPLKGKMNEQLTSFTGRVEFEDCKEFVLKRTSRENTSPIAGKWEGSYICAQGVTGLTLTLK